MPLPNAEEIRQGLFVLRFDVASIQNGEHEFHLRTCDYHPYTLVICKEDECAGPTLSLVKNYPSKLKTLPAGSSPKDKDTLGLLEKVAPDDLVQYVWMFEEGNQQPKHLRLQHQKPQHQNSKWTWGPVKCSPGKGFDLWIDFGTDIPGEKRVLNQYALLLTEQEHVDVEFNVEGEPMGAHSSVLFASSPVFSTILHNREKSPQSTQVVKVSGVEPHIFQQLLHYVYTGRIPLLHEEGMAEKLSWCAVKFGLEHLKDECARYMLANLSVETVVATLIYSFQNSMSNLFESSLRFVASNYPKVIEHPNWKSIENHPSLVLKISKLAPSEESTRGP